MKPHLSFLFTISALCLTCGPASFAKDGSEILLRVATAQIPVTTSITKNSSTIHRALDTAIKEGADILLTPEGSLSGYTPKFDQIKVDEELAKIVERASNAGIALALGTCYTEPDDGKTYNQLLPAIAQGKLFIRTASKVYCITNQQEL